MLVDAYRNKVLRQKINVDKYKAEESTGQKTLHKEMHDKALKVSRPFGVRLN